MMTPNQEPKSKMSFYVETSRSDANSSFCRGKSAEIILDIDMLGNPNAFNPAELLLFLFPTYRINHSSRYCK